MPKKNTSIRKKKTPLPAKIAVFLIFGLIAGELIARFMDRSLYESFLKAAGIKSTTRMEKFGEQPPEVFHDLVYLSYIDSLAEHKLTENTFAVPDIIPGRKNILRLILEESGIPGGNIARWGVTRSTDLNELYLSLYNKKRIVLPREGLPLMFDVREGLVKTGYILFGQYEPAELEEEIDFCAIVTSVSKLWPERTKIMFFDKNKVTGKTELRHIFLEHIPQIIYFGSGIPGDNLADTFEKKVRPVKNKRIY